MKSMTSDCGLHRWHCASGTTGAIVNATSDSATTSVVNLRNPTINGYGSGIDGIPMLSDSDFHIKNLRIMGFTSKGINVAATNDCDVFIRDMTVSGAFSGGILFAPGIGGATKGSLDNVRLDRNVRTTTAAFGLKADHASNVTVTNSIAARNFGSGFETAVSGRRGSISANGLPAARNIGIANVTIMGNVIGLTGSTVPSAITIAMVKASKR